MKKSILVLACNCTKKLCYTIFKRAFAKIFRTILVQNSSASNNCFYLWFSIIVNSINWVSVFACVLIHLQVKRNQSYYLKQRHKNCDRWNINRTIKYCLDIQVKGLIHKFLWLPELGMHSNFVGVHLYFGYEFVMPWTPDVIWNNNNIRYQKELK